jgi:predicted nuclease of predicted toxin-antitoxin system
VIALASEMNLIILTFDRDYGELIFKYSIKAPPAVIYFREKGQSPFFAGQILGNFLSDSDITFKNAFTVIEDKNIRQRFYKK